MAYVNVAEWKPDQVTEWIRGLDSCIEPYVHGFLNNSVGGGQILGFGADDLEHLGITKIGHQEIILEGIDHLRNIHYELDRENLQLLAMRLSCLSHSLHNELCQSHGDTERLSTQILADISTIVAAVKPLICWLDRPGFSGELEYERCRKKILKLALRMATCGQRDRFVEAPVSEMNTASVQLAKLADSIVQDMTDPLILQPASLDLATIKKRSSDDLGFYIVPSFRGVHKISDMKLNSAAHQSGKIEPGDEIIQINYQTVVGWSVKEVMSLFAESPNETLLTLKKRPRHTKVYGQIYVKPYRLPSKKRAIQQAHTADILTRIHFRIPIHSLKIPIPSEKKKESDRSGVEGDRCREDSSSDEEVATVQHKLVVPSKPVHRRATITGASPLSKRPPFDIHELWHEMKLEKESVAKQSTTSVIDFEERLSSVGKDAEQPLNESALETLTIKQKIEMFSRESERNDRNKNPPSHPPKPQIRINSEPIFDNKTLSDAVKINSGQRKISTNSLENKPIVVNERTLLNESGMLDERKIVQEKVQKSENYSLDKFKFESLEKNTVHQDKNKTESIVHDKLYKLENFSLEKNINTIESKNISDKYCPDKISKIENFISVAKERSVEIVHAIPKERKVDNVLPVLPKERNVDNFVPVLPKERNVENSGPKEQNVENFNNKEQNVGNVILKERSADNLAQVVHKERSADNLAQVVHKERSADNLAQVVHKERSADNFAPVVHKERSVDNFAPVVNRERNSDPITVENEEHGKVVQTINRHLLMNKLSDDSDVLEYPCYKPKPQDCTSNSLPHHGKSRVDSYERKTTHSLPTRGRAECDSELSRTISKVITEERERMSFSRNKAVKSKEHKPLMKTGQSIFYSKSYSSESLDKGCEGRPRQDHPDLAYKYNSLEDRHLRREGGAGGESRGPPVPPPRPSLSKPSNACYRAAMIAAHHLIGKASPKSHRKKHPLVSKGRNVSVKDFPSVEVEGWLLQRCRKGSGTWNRRWCLIYSNTLYAFVTRQASKAETLVGLPGFTAAPAEEVKSRAFAFKVYHTGTMFYFAAETNFELSVWLDAITTSTLGPNPNAQAVVYSESEAEESPVRKAPTPAPRPPSGSGESGGNMFGSLKKSSSGGSSLDRKCLRILGPGPVPVPTAHYRSYRRVHNAPPIPNSSSSSSCREQATDLDPPPADMADYRLTSHSAPPVPRRRTVVREQDNWNTPVRPAAPVYDDRIRRHPEHMPIPASVPIPPPSWEAPEHPGDPFSKPPSTRKKIKMKKPHLGGAVRGLYPAPQPINRHPPRPPTQESLVSQHGAATEYPGLEYPPVFEPGTYTLDPGTLLLSRHPHQPPS